MIVWVRKKEKEKEESTMKRLYGGDDLAKEEDEQKWFE